MHDSRHRLASSKSMGQMPFVSYAAPPPPSTAAPSGQLGGRSRDRVSISNLINAVDNARITSTPSSSPQPPSPRIPARNRKTGRNRASSAHGSRGGLGQVEIEDIAARRRKIQSEKKRMWRKNLSPDQKAKRQELDAQRKREQRMNMTPDQRAEARRKDAARKAAKRRLQKEQLRGVDGQSSTDGPSSPSPVATPVSGIPMRRTDGHASMPFGMERAGFNRSTIEDLLN